MRADVDGDVEIDPAKDGVTEADDDVAVRAVAVLGFESEALAETDAESGAELENLARSLRRTPGFFLPDRAWRGCRAS